jgi:two-component system, NtrC family, sensor kinase
MKSKLGFIVVFFLSSVVNLQAQAPTSIFNVDHIPNGHDIKLDGWKYNAGDQLLWADPVYDDSDWENVDGETDIADFIKRHPNHIGWFRVKFKVTDKLRKNYLALSLNAFAATEVYLNGELVKKSGVINQDPLKVQAVNGNYRSFPVQLNNDSVQVLAVRYAYQKGIPYLREIWKSNTLIVRLTVPANVVDSFLQLNQNKTKNLVFFLVGLFFILSILHGLFFVTDRYKKQHLYYGIFTFLVASIYAGIILQSDIYLIKDRMWLAILSHVIWVFHSGFFTLAIYSLFQYKKRSVLKILILVSVLAVPLVFFKQNNFVNLFILFLPLFYNAEAFRVVLQSRKQKVPGTGILIIGLLVFMILWLLSMILIATQAPLNIDIGTFINSVGSTSFLIMMSMILSLQVAGINKKLIEKLKEVEELSIEKQTILESQNIRLEEQVQKRTIELKKTVEDLESTQAHLIQSAKMASLGEMTAGIAHEIQNPLNFVNNFSEVNAELIDELKYELATGKVQSASEIADNIKANEERINHHGKRADAIVKGMLQHSRSSSGQKEPTDINALADEYLRLAYHGLRAKDKSFNADIKTDFDNSTGNINIIPQDIGRVILNLINNAFYAVNEKSKQNIAGYEPTVEVSTRKEGNKVLLSVKDNGNGIPQKIFDKIFQPFFTTKPSGQGTGLGLSLSYDIVKAHRGELKVETKEGEGSKFIIVLPSNL